MELIARFDGGLLTHLAANGYLHSFAQQGSIAKERKLGY